LYCCIEEAREEYDMGRGRDERGKVIYVERDLYLRSRVIFWASNENG
jgi:hypothetical protein